MADGGLDSACVDPPVQPPVEPDRSARDRVRRPRVVLPRRAVRPAARHRDRRRRSPLRRPVARHQRGRPPGAAGVRGPLAVGVPGPRRRDPVARRPHRPGPDPGRAGRGGLRRDSPARGDLEPDDLALPPGQRPPSVAGARVRAAARAAGLGDRPARGHPDDRRGRARRHRQPARPAGRDAPRRGRRPADRRGGRPRTTGGRDRPRPRPRATRWSRSCCRDCVRRRMRRPRRWRASGGG